MLSHASARASQSTVVEPSCKHFLYHHHQALDSTGTMLLSLNKGMKGLLLQPHHSGSSLLMWRGRSPTVTAVVATLRYKSTRPDFHREGRSGASVLPYTAISDWLVQLRWKAAQMLTSSLSVQERQELLRRVNLPATTTTSEVEPSTNHEDENENEKDVAEKKNTSHSIAEAVAAARAQEIKLNQERWEREKDKLFRDAEIAARERVESDLRIQQRQMAFEQWKKRLAEEAAANEEATVTPAVAVPTANAVPPHESVNVATEQQQQQQEAEELHPHPVLGPCVLDLGYKRLHVVKASALAAIPVWEKQRIYRHDRAKTMAVDKLKTLHLGMPGVIGLYEHADGKLAILDGQHRIGMFTILEGMKKGSVNSFLERIVVEVYSKPPDAAIDNNETSSEPVPPGQQDATLAKEIFLEINKAEPVKLVDIPGIVKNSERKILNEAVDQLCDAYPEMFRPSTKCLPPHLNLDNVRDAIFAANVMSRHKMKSTKQLFDWLQQQNTLLGEKYKSSTKVETESRSFAKAVEKAIKHEFYLGLESSWYYN